MKKLLVLAAIFTLALASCAQPGDEDVSKPLAAKDKKQDLTIRNQSSYDLTDVKFSGVTFSISSSNDLLVNTNSVKSFKKTDADEVGYITFTRKDIGITLRTASPISFSDYDYVFPITNNTLVQEQGNTTNQRTLSAISFLSKVSIEHGGLSVAKYETINLGETVRGDSKANDFVLKNNGVGKLILTGNQPVKVEGESGIFTVVQPASSEIEPNKSLPFKINFNPREGRPYTATVTINSNDKDGDFSFTITATGVNPKPIISVHYDDIELSPNATIDAGEEYITLSKNITITIKNDGAEVLTIDTTSIHITGTDAAAFNRLTYPGSSISPGQQSSFIIECKPVKEGVNQAILSIPNNDISHNPATFFLDITGVKGQAIPELTQGNTLIGNNSLTPVDFGVVEVGEGRNSTLAFNLKNTGNIALELTGNPIFDITPSVFAVSLAPSITTIQPDGSVSFILRYTPSAEGEVLGKAIFFYNEGEEFIINVKGTGYVKKPQISVSYGGTAIPQEGTINVAAALITSYSISNIVIRNTGDAPLTIEPANFTITGVDAGAFQQTTTPATTIAANGQTQFTIQFTPTREGENNATLTIYTNDALRSPYIIHLKATGERGHAFPELKQGTTVIENGSLTPIDFRVVELSSYKDLIFDIRNIGNIPLELTGSPLLIASSDAVFAPVQPTNTTIAPNGTLSFIIRYTPTVEKEDTGIITIASNSDDMLFTFRVKGTGYKKMPQITLKQGTVNINNFGEYDFGTVPTDEPKSVTFAIGNTGDAPLTFSSDISLSGSNAELFAFTAKPSESTAVAPESTTDLTIRFAPTVQGSNFNAIVQITTNSRDNNTFTFTVKGNGYQKRPQITLKQGSTEINNAGEKEFGLVATDESNSLVFTIGNSGDAPLNFINVISLTNNAAGHFTITDGPTTSTAVTPNGTTTFTVRFNPQAEGTNLNATVQIKTNSKDYADYSFTVKGNGRVKKPQITLKRVVGTASLDIPYLYEHQLDTVVISRAGDVTYTIGNSGEADLIISEVGGSRISLVDNTSGMFSVIAPLPATTVAPGGTTTFTIRVSPTTVGNASATVKIVTNSENESEFLFTLKSGGRNYQIGDIGPGGGAVFSVDVAGNRYKEVTPHLGATTWANAKATASALVTNGLSDWRLPTKEELNIIYLFRSNLGSYQNSSSAGYWASDEDGDKAWWLAFYNNVWWCEPKTYTEYVRVVREFSVP